MTDSTGGHGYKTPTWYKHLVSVYTGLDFKQIGGLNYLEFLQYRRDAFINWLSQSEKGQEYLDNAWRMEQTKPERSKLREKYGRKEAPLNGR